MKIHFSFTEPIPIFSLLCNSQKVYLHMCMFQNLSFFPHAEKSQIIYGMQLHKLHSSFLGELSLWENVVKSWYQFK